MNLTSFPIPTTQVSVPVGNFMASADQAAMRAAAAAAPINSPQFTGQASMDSLKIAGVDGDGFITLVTQSIQPAPPTAGTALLHASDTGGITRIELSNEAPTNLTIGRDNRFLAANNTGSTLAKGALVNITDGAGPANDIPSIVLADATNITKFPVTGIVQDDISDGVIGYVMVVGIIKDIDGQGFTPGFTIYLHPSIPGGITDSRPVSPDRAQPIGYVLDGGNPTGAFFIHVGPFVGGLESGTTADTWNGKTVNASVELQTSGNRVGYNLAAYGTGTVYTLTNTSAAVAFGTTSPSLTIDKAGTYLIYSHIQLRYVAATVATETATVKLRRTNNTAADLTSGSTIIDLPVSTTLTHTYGVVAIPPVIYVTANANDVVTIFANVSAALGTGTIAAEIGGTNIVAIRLY